MKATETGATGRQSAGAQDQREDGPGDDPAGVRVDREPGYSMDTLDGERVAGHPATL
jgi:hypothetical protein